MKFRRAAYFKGNTSKDTENYLIANVRKINATKEQLDEMKPKNSSLENNTVRSKK